MGSAEQRKTGVNVGASLRIWLTRVLCNRLALHTTFFGVCCEPARRMGVCCSQHATSLGLPNINLRSDALPSEGDSFTTTSSPPHTNEPVEGAAPASLAPFFFVRPKFGQAASRKQQRGDRDEGDQNGRLKIGKHLQPHTTNPKALHDVHFQMKSPEIAEELTATTPLPFGRQSMNN